MFKMYEHTVDISGVKENPTSTQISVEPVIATDVEDNLSRTNDTDGPEFAVGDVVEVMPRTWSGINKPGGPGRIKAVTFDDEEEEYTYSVRYILHGGIEKNVSGVYINLMNEVNKQQRGIKGRCTWCRCFIRDCQHNQDIDPYYVEPAKPVEEQLYFSVDPPLPTTTTTTTTRKRPVDSAEAQEAKRQKQLKKEEARRLASEAYEKEFEKKLLAVALKMKLLPDDEMSTGTLVDEGELSEEDGPYDPAFAVKSRGGVKRIIAESDDEEEEREVALVLPVSQWDDGHHVEGEQASQAATDTSAENPALRVEVSHSHSARSVVTGGGAVQLHGTVRTQATTSAPSNTVVDLSEDTSSASAASQDSQGPADPQVAARRLHRDILHSCLGPAERSGFINNSENAHNDRNPADVSRQFKVLLHSIPNLRDEEKVQLYLIAYDWFETRLAQAMAMDAKLDTLDVRVRNLEKQLSKTDSFGTPQDEELSKIEGKLERLEWRLTVVFEELERAGFDVFQRLRNIKHPEVRRRTFLVDKWKADVLDTKVVLLRHFRLIQNAFEDVEGAWSMRANSYHASYSDSEDETLSRPATSTRPPAAPRLRDAAKEAGTLVRASSTTSTVSASRHVSAARSDKTAGMSRTSSGHSHKSSRDSTQVASSSSSSAPKRARHRTDAHRHASSFDDDFIDNTEYVPRSDGEGDEAVEMEVVETSRGGQHNRPVRPQKSASERQQGGERGMSRSYADNRYIDNSVPSKSAPKGATAVRKYPKGVQRELNFIFGASQRDKKIGDDTSDKESLSRSHSGGDSADGRPTVRGEPGPGLYQRASIPSVLDLPPHVRYHGRVTVLEGIVSGARVLPSAPVSVSASGLSSRTASDSAIFGEFGCFESLPFGNDDYSTLPGPPLARASHSHQQMSGSSAVAVSAPRLLPSFGSGPLSTVSNDYDLSDWVEHGFDPDFGDESLVDVVLSSMVNPFAVQPPLHTRRQFYQLSACIGGEGEADVGAVDVWAEGFVENLVSEAISAGGNNVEVSETAVGIVRALSPVVVSTVSHLQQSIANYEEMVARNSQLHAQPLRTSSNTKFNSSVEFGSLVSVAGEKLAKLSAVLAGVTKNLFAPAPEADSTGRMAGFTSLVGVFELMERVAYSQAQGSAVPDLRSFLLHVTLADSKCSDLSAHIALSALRMKVSVLKNCALRTVELAKSRQAVDTSDVMAVMDRMEREAADWDVMNFCFEQLLAVQRDVVAALLGSGRVLLAVLHSLSAIPPLETLPSATTPSPECDKFEKGISGVAKLLACALYETLAALRILHVTINTARTSSANGVRVWACYEASREQANGVIATYQKNVWRGVTLEIYAHIAGGQGHRNSSDNEPLLRGSVNPVVLSKPGAVLEDDAAESGMCEEDAIWGVMTIFTHCLRSVKVADTASAPAARTTSRVEGAWSLLKGLAQVTTQAALKLAAEAVVPNKSTPTLGAGGVGAESVVRLLRRVGHFAALWLDSSSDATALTLSVINQVSPTFGTLLPVQSPLASGSVTSALSGTTPALESKSVLFLCYHAFFTTHQASANDTAELQTRRNLARQLGFAVGMMFETFKIPHISPSEARSFLTEPGNTATTEKSLRTIQDLCGAFKEMLYNAYTEACGPRDIPAITSNLAAIKTAAAKVPRTHQKLHLMDLLNSAVGGDLQCGTMLLGQVAELVGFFGADAVRHKLKLVPALGTAAVPLQQQLMDVLSSKFAAVSHSLSAPTVSAGVPVLSAVAASGVAAGAVTMSEIDQLLQKVPLQQHSERQVAVSAVSAVTAAPVLDAAGLQLCLLWHAGLLSLAPFPADATLCASSDATAALTEAYLKRIIDAQRQEEVYLQPLVHLLRHSVQSQQSSREWMSLPGVKKTVEASLGACLASSATILKHVDSVHGSKCTIRLDTRAEGSDDVHSHLHQLRALHAPLLTEILSVVHMCLAVTSKDGMQNSASYVMSQVILHLRDWQAATQKLLLASHNALNLDAPARAFVATTAAEEQKKLTQLLGEVFRVRASPTLQYKASNTNHQAVKPSGSELVAVFRSILLSLFGSLKSLEVCGLDFSADFAATSSATEFAGVTSKYKVHKNNLAPGCCFAICESLGALVSLLLDTQYTPNTSTTSATFVQAVVTEVMETLEKVDQAAAMVSANGLLGNWLKVVFWSPILKAVTASAGANAIVMLLVSPHFSSLVCAWMGCALAGSSVRTLSSVAQQISLPGFHHMLVTLSPVLLQALRAKCGASGVGRLAPAELQSVRLVEIFTQVSIRAGSADHTATAVAFVRLVAASSTSTVLAALLTSSWYGGVTSHSFPAAHRAAFEATNVQLSREVLKCMHVLNFTVFRYGDVPARAAEKMILLAKVATLKGVFCDAAYLYRVLIAPGAPRATLLTDAGGYASAPHSESSSMHLTAQLLRGVAQLPRMATLDQADSFLAGTVETDVCKAVSSMFKCALKGNLATAEDRINLKAELKRDLLVNLPKYLLLASDTPYSTRQTAWRVLLAPLLLTPAHTTTGLYFANQRAGKLSAHNATAPLLTESSIGEDAYYSLLVCALTLALPVPEQLARLVPAMRVSGDNTLRARFVELVTARLKLPVKQVTLWELYAQLEVIAKNTCDGASVGTPVESTQVGADLAQRQDPQLARFKQYLLLGGGSTTATNATGASGRTSLLGANLSAQSTALWEQVGVKAQEMLGARVDEEQQRQSLGKRGPDFQSASVAMCQLPAASVRAALHLHTAVLEDVLQDLIRHVSFGMDGENRGDVEASQTVALLPANPVLVPSTASEKEEVLSLVVCGAFYAMRAALSLIELCRRVSSEFSFITEVSKNNLQAQLQYCRLAAEGARSAWKHLQAVVQPWQGSSTDNASAVGIHTETEIVRRWGSILQQMRQVLNIGTDVRTAVQMLVMSCWRLLQQLYFAGGCNNMPLVDSFLTSAAHGYETTLPAPPQVAFSASLCACALCVSANNGAVTYDGSENPCSVQALQHVVLQVHRALLQTSRTGLTAEQSATLQNELSSVLVGVGEDIEQLMNKI